MLPGKKEYRHNLQNVKKIVSISLLNCTKIKLTTKIQLKILCAETSHHLWVCIENKFLKAGVSKQDHCRISVLPYRHLQDVRYFQLLLQALSSFK